MSCRCRLQCRLSLARAVRRQGVAAAHDLLVAGETPGGKRRGMRYVLPAAYRPLRLLPSQRGLRAGLVPCAEGLCADLGWDGRADNISIYPQIHRELSPMCTLDFTHIIIGTWISTECIFR